MTDQASVTTTRQPAGAHGVMTRITTRIATRITTRITDPLPTGRLAGAAVRWHRVPPWAQALVVMAGCMLLTAFMLDRAGRFTVVDAEGHTERWSYLPFVARWDSAWYRRIAEEGYPGELPLDPVTGEVRQNAWAFYPLFPMLARGLLGLGLSWPVAGWLVSVVAALVAAVLLRALVDSLAGPQVALWSVALLGSFTTAPALQLPYSDAVALALLIGVFWSLRKRHYAVTLVLLPLVGFARPVAVPLALVVLVHVVRRCRDRLPLGFALLVAAGLSAVSWPAVAALVTGRRTAYTDTMAAWRGGRGIVPVDPWLDASARYLGPFAGRVLLGAAVLGLLVWLTRPVARRLGADLRVWCVAYGAYLIAVLDPTTSLARYLLGFFPLGVLLLVASPSRAFRITLVAAGFVTQLVWIVTIWRGGAFPP